MKRLVRVAGKSMAPTYRPAALLLTTPVGRAGARPRPGDVVVLRRAGVRMIKRVVGVPGDVVELEAGRLFVNGASVDGRVRIRGARTEAWHVPAGACFVVGDNPAASDDSRVWAEPFVAAADVEAVVRWRLRAPRPVGLLRGPRPAAAARPGR